MSIDLGANDFVNRCVLSPHVADGFVLVLVQLDIFFVAVASKKMDSAPFFFSLRTFSPGTAVSSNGSKTGEL